jgi:signal peptide peptidase SppA
MQRMISFVQRDESWAELREQALSARDGVPLQNTRKVEMRDGVASIPISGPLFRHAGLLEQVCDATSYSSVRKDLQAALDDPAVQSIVLNIDSPGGEVNGVAELADAIYAARGTKPIIAYVGGMGASAAYWLAAAADKVVASSTAQLGSIGVIATYAAEQGAAQSVDIVSSQSPKKKADPMTDAGRAQIQDRVDALARVFVGAVARYRGVAESKVLSDFGKGDVFVGADAVAAGLADEIGNYEAVLASLVARATQRSNHMFVTQMAALFGLDEKATEEQLIERATAAARTERDVIAATGAANADEAIGRIRANAEAAIALGQIREEQSRSAAVKLRGDFHALLEGAVGAGGPMSLGQLATVVPSLLDDGEDAKVSGAIGKLEDQSATSLLACFADATISPKAMTRVAGFVKALGPSPAAATTHVEPKADEHGGHIVDETERRIADAAKKNRERMASSNKKTTK